MYQNQHVIRNFPYFSYFIKYDFFLKYKISKSIFCTTLLWIYTTYYKALCLSWNLYLAATWRSPTNAICKKKNETFKILYLPLKNNYKYIQNMYLLWKLQYIFWKFCQNFVFVIKNDFWCVTNTSECDKAPRLRRETKQWNLGNIKKNNTSCRIYHRHDHTILHIFFIFPQKNIYIVI